METSHDGGSPPRTWGRLEHIDTQGDYFRFTPTHVGTMGLSWAYSTFVSRLRFTPTHVGTITYLRLLQIPESITVHPHARGDDVIVVRR